MAGTRTSQVKHRRQSEDAFRQEHMSVRAAHRLVSLPCRVRRVEITCLQAAHSLVKPHCMEKKKGTELREYCNLGGERLSNIPVISSKNIFLPALCACVCGGVAPVHRLA